MDWKTMQADLRRLAALTDAWSQADEIPAVERDLALEKLRNLYEAIRFAEPSAEQGAEKPAAVSEEEVLPESLDLGEVLSLDEFPDLEEPAGPIFVEPAAVYAPGSDGSVPEPMPVEEPTETPEPAAEPEPTETPEPAAEPELTAASEPTETPEPAAEPEPTAAPEPTETPVPAAEPEPTAAPEPTETPEPAAEPELTAASEPTETPEPAAEPAESVSAESEPVVTLDPMPTPEPARAHHVSPTLFGMEDEETVRHRHKQRVIMSLYGPSPEPLRSSADSKVPDGSASAVKKTTKDSESTPELDTVEVQTPVFETTRSAGNEVAAGTMPTAPIDEAPDATTQEEEFEPTLSEVTIPHSSSEPGQPVDAAGTWDSETDSAVPVSSGGAVLGEVINHDVQTLADTIAPPRDVASELRRSEPVTDLRRAIGLNDKFLLIRDLFGGDGEAFERAIETLNGFEDLDDCMIFIAEHYAWNPNSDGAKLLMELLERKFA